MTWIVKRKDPDGKIPEIIKDDYQAAHDLQQEFQSQGFTAWVEDEEGKLVGPSMISDPPAEPG